MNEQNKKVPTVRFKGFTNDWEQQKLGDFGSVAMNKRIFKKQTTEVGDVPFYKIGTFGKKPDAYISNELFEEYKSKYPYPKEGDLLISASGSIGRIVEYKGQKAYYQDSNIVWLKHNDQLNNLFLKAFYQIVKWDGTEGSTIKRLYNKNILRTRIFLPTTLEQEKVGNIIECIERLLALQQRKLDLLKQLKKGLLQKMFADKDSERPVLRFKGFHDDWEQRRLGEVTSHRGGTAIEKYFDENGEYKVISIGSYGLDSKYVDQNIRAKSNEVTNERVVHAGELTMVLNDKTANGTIIGRSLLIENDNEYVINQRTEIIKPEESFNAKFAYTLLNGPFRNKVKRIVQGGTQIYVNYSSVEKLTVPLPNMKEQQKIGSFFNQLDSLIALHQRKQNHLKLLKKSLLQQMFM